MSSLEEMIAETRQKCKDAEFNSCEQESEKAKWIAMANAEAEAEAPRCTDVAIAHKKALDAPRNSQAEAIWLQLSTTLELNLTN